MTDSSKSKSPFVASEKKLTRLQDELGDDFTEAETEASDDEVFLKRKKESIRKRAKKAMAISKGKKDYAAMIEEIIAMQVVSLFRSLISAF
jgi:hypothetical protein